MIDLDKSYGNGQYINYNVTPRDVLESLISHAESAAKYGAQGYDSSEWAAPLDLGGTNGSPHSYVLSKLVDAGLVEFRRRGFGPRGSKEYRITNAGRAALANDTRTE